MNTEVERLYRICRATGLKANRALNQARTWINGLDDTSKIQLTH